MSILPGAASQGQVAIPDHHIVTGRGYENPPSLDGISIFRLPDLQSTTPAENFGEIARGAYVHDDQHRGFTDLFSLVDKRHKIYAKKMTPLRPSMDFGKPLPQRDTLPKVMPARREHDISGEIQKEADRLVLQHMVPSGVVIDTQLQVVQFRGSTGVYLEHASGDASLNLLQMVRPNLVVDLRAAIHKALKQNSPARKEGGYLQHRGETLLIDIDVIPFKVSNGGSERWLLVLFQSRSIHAADVPPDGAKRGESKTRPGVELRLRDELRATKESLQAIIEEQEATNEELKSANEEIESSNEELQSSNEELETAKEELQSTNEELQTLNEELNTRNTEMAQINNDLSNLLSSINLPIIMVDNGLTVRRATPLAEKLFNLIPTDIGRRLTDIKPNLKSNDLDKVIRHVIETLETEEREVSDTEGQSYLLRIRPYRTRDNKIDGAVLTLVDIDPVRRSHMRSESDSQVAMAVADVMGGALLVVDPSWRVLAVSAAFRKEFDMAQENFTGKLLFNLRHTLFKLPGLREFLQSATRLPRSRRSKPLAQRFAYGGRALEFRILLLSKERDGLIAVAVTETPAAKKKKS